MYQNEIKKNIYQERNPECTHDQDVYKHSAKFQLPTLQIVEELIEQNRYYLLKKIKKKCWVNSLFFSG